MIRLVDRMSGPLTDAADRLCDWDSDPSRRVRYIAVRVPRVGVWVIPDDEPLVDGWEVVAAGTSMACDAAARLLG